MIELIEEHISRDNKDQKLNPNKELNLFEKLYNLKIFFIQLWRIKRIKIIREQQSTLKTTLMFIILKILKLHQSLLIKNYHLIVLMIRRSWF